MAADTTILQGEVNENPEARKLDVERLLAALLSSLIKEQTAPEVAS
jgi:hypothetical protein